VVVEELLCDLVAYADVGAGYEDDFFVLGHDGGTRRSRLIELLFPMV
jgi:hypothetical protein